jgi:hypothetical protein
MLLAIALPACSAMASGQATWRADVSGAAVPGKPASGRVGGQPFKMDEARLLVLGLNTASDKGAIVDRAQAYHLELRQGREFFADQEFKIAFATDVGKPLDGLEFRWKPYKFGTEEDRKQRFPHPNKGTSVGRGIIAVFITSKGPNGQSKSDNFMNEVSIRLVFGKRQGNSINGWIYLTLPDKDRSFVAGTFTAKIEKLP